MMWSTFKKGFDAWENATAKYLEVWLKSPMVLGPSGAMLSSAMRTKATYDKMVAGMWGTMGLPTKRDQERALYTLNKLESRIYDLEEKLEELKSKDAR
ncbi:MAG: hypothetical protein JNL38_22580 [Myxococcales bacterium]|nr:hypothetical protein [Myxococcales bacterium]